METTFGVWMQDAAQVNDNHIWMAEHFSGTVLLASLKEKTSNNEEICFIIGKTQAQRNKSAGTIHKVDIKVATMKQFPAERYCVFAIYIYLAFRSSLAGVQEHCIIF